MHPYCHRIGSIAIEPRLTRYDTGCNTFESSRGHHGHEEADEDGEAGLAAGHLQPGGAAHKGRLGGVHRTRRGRGHRPLRLAPGADGRAQDAREGRLMGARNGVGPYLFGPRVRALLGFGRVYRTFNGQTGAPAVLETATGATPHRRPTASVQVLVTAWEAPEAALAVEVQSGSPAALAGVLDEAAELAEALPSAALGHLAAPHPILRRRSRRARTGHLVALAAGIVLALLPHAPPVLRERPALVLEDGAGQVAFTLALTSGLDVDGSPRSRPVPRTPFDNQKRAPCDPMVEETINGGCWVETAKRPPCPEQFFEHRGGCFIPAARVERPATSFDGRRP
ncbi:hypothetical protein Mx9_p06 [Myxococcus phage Mx9]|nr:hypothetical protein Mx9_p06 [Myxococcus phage Mx9]